MKIRNTLIIDIQYIVIISFIYTEELWQMSYKEIYLILIHQPWSFYITI